MRIVVNLTIVLSDQAQLKAQPQPPDITKIMADAVTPSEAPAYVPQKGEIVMRCKKCNWWHVYHDRSTARRGLAGHKNWCNRS